MCSHISSQDLINSKVIPKILNDNKNMHFICLGPNKPRFIYHLSNFYENIRVFGYKDDLLFGKRSYDPS